MILSSPFRLSLLLALLLPQATATAQRLEIKRGYWQKRHTPEGWFRYLSANYQIQSQAGKDKAIRLAKHMEAMLKVYKKLFPPGKPRQGRKNVIKLFKNRNQYQAYGGRPGTGGYYTPTYKEMVTFDSGKWMDEQSEEPPPGGDEEDPPDFEKTRRRVQMDILGVAAHEGWHQYFHWFVTSQVPIPSWINEGMGDYFYSAMPKKVKKRRVPAELGRMNGMRLPVIRWAVKKGKHVPIKELIHYEQRQYYSNPGVCYAEGWSLCQFLLHSGNKQYEKIVSNFIKSFRKEKSWKKITERVFKRVDLDKLEEEWKEWVLNASMRDPPGSPAAKKAAGEKDGKTGKAKGG